MKSETRQWLTIAQADYSDSLYLFKGARYPNAIYFICQAIEKLLKAVQIESSDQIPKKTHNLMSLAKTSGLSFSEERIQILEDLFSHYNRVRYPDYQRTKYNTKIKVEPIIKQGKEIYQWILVKLKNL
jgi:HEPN domain-containing protein